MCSPFCERRRLNSAARAAARTRSSALIGTSLATGFPWLVMTNDCPARTRPSSFENSRLASAAEMAADIGGLLYVVLLTTLHYLGGVGLPVATTAAGCIPTFLYMGAAS